jgi:hypothetical protein
MSLELFLAMVLSSMPLVKMAWLSIVAPETRQRVYKVQKIGKQFGYLIVKPHTTLGRKVT